MEQTAEQLVEGVRTWKQNWNQAPFRDGFPEDAIYAGGTGTILFLLNEAQRQLLESGYVKCWFQFQMVAGVKEYSVDPWLHQYTEVNYKNLPLEKTTTGKLDREEPSWRTRGTGTPREFYFVADQIGLHPTPDTDDPIDETQFSLRIRADADLVPLVNRTDTPKRLPSRFHPLLAIGGAWLWSNMDTENEASQAQIPMLTQLWKSGIKNLFNVNQQRGLDEFDQIDADGGYRDHYRRR